MKIILLRLMKLRIMRFLISGGFAASTNLVLLFVLVHFFYVWYLPAVVMSFIVAVYVSFMLQKYFTFGDYTKEKIRQQPITYFGIQIINLGLNTFLMYIGVDLLGIPYLISQILIGSVMAISNFFIYKHIIFKPIVRQRGVLLSACPSCSETDNIEWGRKNGHTLMLCNLCGLIFVSPMPGEVSEIYNETYFSGGDTHGYVDYDRDKETMKFAFELYLGHMESTLGRKGKLLDVGSATGYFMNIARGCGWEVHGVEISEHAASLGRAKGLDVKTGILENLNLRGESFDAITLFDVVEHLRDPKSTLKEVNRLLKKGGIIVVTTPDSGSLWARVFGKRWHLVVPPEHLVLFNRKNFGEILKLTSFTPHLTTTIGKHFTLPYIFQNLYHWQGLGVWNILVGVANKGLLSKLKIPINLRDTFFMIAKK